MTTRLLGLGAKALGGRALTARAVWRARGRHLELSHGLLKGLHRGKGAALNLQTLDGGLQNTQVEAQPLLDGLEIGDSAVKLLQVGRSQPLRGELKAGAKA